MKNSTWINLKYSLFLFTAAFFWGMNFHFAKFMLNETSFIESGTWRYIFGVVPLIFISWKAISKVRFTRESFKGILLVGAIGLFGFNLFFFYGLKYTEAVNAALIVSLNPITTILLSSFLLKTSLTKYHGIGAIVSLVGVIYLLTKGSLAILFALTFNFGDLLIFIANTLFALHHVWVKKYSSSFSNLSFTGLTNIICLLGFLIIMPFDGKMISTDHSFYYWISAVGIGVLGTAAAYLLWNKGINHLGASKGGLFMNVVPLAAAVVAIILGENLYSYHIISGLLIIFGMLISNKFKF